MSNKPPCPKSTTFGTPLIFVMFLLKIFNLNTLPLRCVRSISLLFNTDMPHKLDSPVLNLFNEICE